MRKLQHAILVNIEKAPPFYPYMFQKISLTSDKIQHVFCLYVKNATGVFRLTIKFNKMGKTIAKETPLVSLTVGQFKEILDGRIKPAETDTTGTTEVKHVYGIDGIARLFGCSHPTANRIKRSGVIDKAIKQVGRKIVVDAELALQLATAAKGKGGAI